MQLEEGSEFIKIPPKCISDSISAIKKHVLHIQLKVPTVFEILTRQSVHTRVVSHKSSNALNWFGKKAFFDNDMIIISFEWQHSSSWQIYFFRFLAWGRPCKIETVSIFYVTKTLFATDGNESCNVRLPLSAMRI